MSAKCRELTVCKNVCACVLARLEWVDDGEEPLQGDRDGGVGGAQAEDVRQAVHHRHHLNIDGEKWQLAVDSVQVG